MEGIKRKMEEPPHNNFKTDVFMLGMIMLEAATLQK